jgi:hypothetical protein
MFMKPEITQSGNLYSCECSKCGSTLYTHEWATGDHNERRDAMEAGTLHCDECSGLADPETFWQMEGMYFAGRLSASGYLDCTDWLYGKNKEALMEDINAMYGIEGEE